MAEAKRWWWDDDEHARTAFLEECLAALQGEEKKLTRTHTLICADWGLRQAEEARRARLQLHLAREAIARAAEIASIQVETHSAACGTEQP